MALPIYSSKDVKVSWAGAPVTGLDTDTFITFSYNSDITSEKVGADGKVEISMSPDNTGTCTLTLLQESPANLMFGAAVNAIKYGEFFQGSLTVTDPSGSVLAFMKNAHIKSSPEVTLGSETNAREWTFFVEDLVFASSPSEIATKIADSDLDQIVGGVDTIKNFLA